MSDLHLSKSSKLEFTEDLRSESPFSTPVERFLINPDPLGTFISATPSPHLRQLNFYEVTALRYMYLRERTQEPLVNYVPSAQVEYQLNLLLESHFSLELRDSTLAIALQFLLRTMRINEPRYDFAVKLVCIIHIADKYEPSTVSLRLDQKICRLFGSACFKLNRADFAVMEANLLQEIDYDINYITSFNYLSVFEQIAGLERLFCELAMYLAFLAMCDVELYGQRPSLVAAACVALAAKEQSGERWSNDLYFWSGYTNEMICVVQQRIIALWRDAYDAGIHGRPGVLFKAFLDEKYGAVSTLRLR